MLKKVFPVCSLLLLLLVSCEQLRWKEFSSEAGAFSVLMPGKPEEQTHTLNTAAGDIKLTIYASEMGESLVFFVSYSDYPPEVAGSAVPGGLLRAARDSTVQSQGGKLLASYGIALGGHPGLSYVAEAKVQGREAVLRARNFMVGSRLYQIFALGERGEGSTEKMAKFLGSFRLKKM
ncbi:MAG TPA: hypothetical protein VMX75_00755 [Spirochaetia bacterium]|nr:hypothetical protein [Spirochaetia bacterium]